MSRKRSALLLVGLVGPVAVLQLGCPQLLMPAAMLAPAVAGPDFSLQGEYAAGTGRAPVGAQVVARGAGSFLAVLWSGGLPGAGFDGRLREELSGSRDGSAVVFEGSGQARLEGGRLTGTTGAGLPFTVERLERSSPTLGASAPAGASTSFDTPLVD